MSRKTKLSLTSLAIVAALVAGTAVRGGSSHQTPKARAAGLPPVGRIAHRVEAVRGLRFRYVPKVELVSARELEGKVGKGPRVSRRVQREAIAAQGAAALTGIVRQEDLEQQGGGSGGGGTDVGGVYVPQDKRVYLVRDAVERSPGLAETVIAHELTHALEDQHFHDFELASRPFADSTNARRALLEGSATLSELRYAQRYLHQRGDLEALLAKRARDFADPSVSPALRAVAAFPYVAGGRFVASLHAQGGWKLVNFAHRHAPHTTEAILHPQGWHGTDRQRRPRFAIDKPIAAGWARIARADAGELDTEQLLRTGLDATDARRGAAGWDAGSFETWSPQGADLEHCKLPCRGKLASVLAWRWDSPKDAREFATLMRRAILRGLHAKPAGADGFALDGGAATLRLFAGRRTALAYAPTLAEARLLVRAASNG